MALKRCSVSNSLAVTKKKHASIIQVAAPEINRYFIQNTIIRRMQRGFVFERAFRYHVKHRRQCLSEQYVIGIQRTYLPVGKCAGPV